MPRLRNILLTLLMASAAAMGTHAQTPAPADAALVARFVTATDLDRTSLFDARPEIGAELFVAALLELGSEQARVGDFQNAEQTYRSVLWIGDKQSNPVTRTRALANLLRVFGERGDFAQAREFGTEALAIAEQQNDIESVQVALANLGIIQRKIGAPDAALVTMNRAFALAQDLKFEGNAARVLNNMGLVHSDLGNIAVAHDYLTRALAMKMKFEDRGGPGTQDIARTLGNLGNLFEEQGDFRQAIHHYDQTVALLEKSGGGPALTSAISNTGHAYLALGQLDQARTYFERAMAMAESAGDGPRAATILYLFGALSRAAGRLDEAEDYQRRSLAIREQVGESLALVESMTELASLALVAGRLDEALALANRAVTLASESRLLARLWKAQMMAAQVKAALGRDADAVAGYQASITTIETLRQLTAGGDRARQLYLGNRLGPYYGLARVHAKAGRTFEAFAVVENARARTLLDILAVGRQPTRLLTDAQRLREQQLLHAVVSASSQIDVEASKRKPDAARLSVLDGELRKARFDREAFLTALYEAKPDLRIARGEAPVVSRAELAMLVPKGTAIISFVLEQEHAWAYLVTAGPNGPSVTAKQLPIAGTALANDATRFAEQVGTRDLGFSGSARTLYDTLFVSSGFDKALADITNLVIVPDGALWRIPFQALQTPRGKFVIEERAISYAHSVSALASLSRRRQSRPVREPFLLALGDPAGSTLPAAPGDQRGVQRRLPEAAREVRALGKLYGEEKSTVFVSAEATERALRANLSKASVVHVATHGVLDDRSPMYSHLMLAPSAPGDSASDGRLEAWEVMDLGVTADLAVLSACQTARGSLGDGEGVIGLSWSLFAAGASTAVVSLWEVDSASTTQLMIAFHEQLLSAPPSQVERRTAPQALRGAAMRLMKAPAYRHPFYWAGFVAVGAP